MHQEGLLCGRLRRLDAGDRQCERGYEDDEGRAQDAKENVIHGTHLAAICGLDLTVRRPLGFRIFFAASTVIPETGCLIVPDPLTAFAFKEPDGLAATGVEHRLGKSGKGGTGGAAHRLVLHLRFWEFFVLGHPVRDH